LLLSKTGWELAISLKNIIWQNSLSSKHILDGRS
jgi:hypothetical protein